MRKDMKENSIGKYRFTLAEGRIGLRHYKRSSFLSAQCVVDEVFAESDSLSDILEADMMQADLAINTLMGNQNRHLFYSVTAKLLSSTTFFEFDGSEAGLTAGSLLQKLDSFSDNDVFVRCEDSPTFVRLSESEKTLMLIVRKNEHKRSESVNIGTFYQQSVSVVLNDKFLKYRSLCMDNLWEDKFNETYESAYKLILADEITKSTPGEEAQNIARFTANRIATSSAEDTVFEYMANNLLQC